MNPTNGFYQRALIGSSLAHLLFFGVLLILPTGERGEDVTVYTVRVMEAPARPEVSAVSPLEALRLEAPSLDPERPQPPDTDATPDLNLAVPSLPDSPLLQQTPGAPPPPPQAAPEMPVLPQGTQPSEAAPTAPPSTLPAAPAPPGLAPAAPPAPPAPGETPQSTAPPTPPAVPPPGSGETLERVRERVRDINLRVESTPAPSGASGGDSGIVNPAQQERSLFALRLFTNSVREAVKENYTFPGGFPPELRTRVRVVLRRDGTVKDARVIQPSGNERFDRLVCLASIHKARFPHAPTEVEGEELPFTITCAP